MMASVSSFLPPLRPPKPLALLNLPSVVAPSSKVRTASPALYSSKFTCRSDSSPPPVDSGEGAVDEKPSTSAGGVSSYTWCAGLGALGFAETCYLTFLKVTDSEAFCPVGGESCGNVLNSDYAVVYGVPLPIYGMIAYGCVSLLGLQLSGKKIIHGLGEANLRLVLLGCTTTMASASAYFLYLLYTQFSGTLCLYCLFSALLSFSLVFLTLKNLRFQEIQKFVGVQLAIAGIVLAALSNSYSAAQSQLNLNELDLQPFETEITTESTPFAISLAKHLHSLGAKMYGAFWCSHCIEQKQMFGREAMKIVDYVECFPEGFGKGRKMDKACADAGIEGFPTWVVKNQVLSGEQDLADLAQASGFDLLESHRS